MNSDTSKLASMIGMCAKAGKIINGVPLVCGAMRGSSPPLLVLYSHTASQNSKKRITDKCLFYNIECKEILLDTGELAEYTGKSGAVAAVGITDAGLARAVLGLIPKENSKNETAPFIDEERI